MRAAVRDGSGEGAPGVRDFPNPVPAPGEALARLRAAALNRGGLSMRGGGAGPPPPPPAPPRPPRPARRRVRRRAAALTRLAASRGGGGGGITPPPPLGLGLDGARE